MNKYIFIILILLFPSSSQAAYSFYRSITINAAQVPSSQVNFPITVSGTYSYLATIGNGGKIQNASGFDIGFFSNDTCATKLSWETVLYTATTGEVEYWIRLPTITNGTTFYMCYGDSNISTDQSSGTAVWDSNFKAVYHIPNGTTLSGTDSTTNVNNLTAAGTIAATRGRIDGGVSGTGTNGQTMGRTASISNIPALNASQTIELWFTNNATDGNNYSAFILRNTSAGSGISFYREGVDNLSFQDAFGTNYTLLNHDDPTVGTWHQAVFTTDGTNNTFYWDGASFSTGVDSLATDAVTAIRLSTVDGTNNAWNGRVDEVRVSSTNRTTNWITTGYNAIATTTFYTISNEANVIILKPFKYVLKFVKMILGGKVKMILL